MDNNQHNLDKEYVVIEINYNTYTTTDCDVNVHINDDAFNGYNKLKNVFKNVFDYFSIKHTSIYDNLLYIV